MPDKIHLTVATLVIKDSQYLMITETDADKIVYNQPAGHVEPGEDILDAAIRETLEETGWQVSLTGFVGLYTYQSKDNGITFYRACFVATPLYKDNRQTIDPDIQDIYWMTEQQIRDCEQTHRSPLVLKCLEDYLQGPIYPLEIFRKRL